MYARSELLTSNGLRVDGRRCDEIRNIKLKLGTVTGISGSSEVEMGMTKVQVCIIGPSEKPASFMDKSFLVVKYNVSALASYELKSVSTKSKQNDEIRTLIKRTFEPIIIKENFEKSILEICVFVLQQDGGVLSTVLNAVTLALVDASIPLYDYICSCTTGLIQDNPIADLSLIEESSKIPSLFLAIMPRKDSIVTIDVYSPIDAEKLNKMIDTAFECCKTIKTQINETVRKSIKHLIAPAR